MPQLSSDAFTISGGCFCKAIRYTVALPALPARSKLPPSSFSPENDLVPRNEVNERFPRIEIDHCHSCRKVQGSLIQSWIILPQAWVRFSLLLRPSSTCTVPKKEEEEEKLEIIEPDIKSYLTGAPQLVATTYISHFSSSAGVNRTFCARCGTHITFYYDEVEGKGQLTEPRLDLTTGSLDDEVLELEGFRPSVYAHPGDGISWVRRWLSVGEKTLLE